MMNGSEDGRELILYRRVNIDAFPATWRLYHGRVALTSVKGGRGVQHA
jgi:hypothetical protein